MNKKSKVKETNDSEPEGEMEHFKFLNFGIRSETDLKWEQGCKDWLNKSNFRMKCTLTQEELQALFKILNPTKKAKIIHYKPLLWG